MTTSIRLAGVVKESYTDGLGIRYVVFTQGCRHHCKKCHNPETWDFYSGYDKNIDDLLKDILENPLLDGVTLSGGDPLYQIDSIEALIDKIREKSSLNIWLYTGFKFEDCIADKDMLKILRKIDVLVDGEYRDECRSLELRFRGSTNQRIIDVKKSLETGVIHLFIDD